MLLCQWKFHTFICDYTFNIAWQDHLWVEDPMPSILVVMRSSIVIIVVFLKIITDFLVKMALQLQTHRL